MNGSGSMTLAGNSSRAALRRARASRRRADLRSRSRRTDARGGCRRSRTSAGAPMIRDLRLRLPGRRDQLADRRLGSRQQLREGRRSDRAVLNAGGKPPPRRAHGTSTPVHAIERSRRRAPVRRTDSNRGHHDSPEAGRGHLTFVKRRRSPRGRARGHPARSAISPTAAAPPRSP
jgi:hypothetical protein